LHRPLVARSLRLVYWLRLGFRVAVLVLVTMLCLRRPQAFQILTRFGFFKKRSPLHLLWVIWIADMLCQLIPSRGIVSVGSQKHFARYWLPTGSPVPQQARRSANRRALVVFLLWTALTVCLGLLHHWGILSNMHLFWITALFYVCDLVCVLIWCPFQRIILKTRCCTTCRIFNWDHLMMFSPLIFVPGFYTWTLVGMAGAIFLVWEIRFARHPERFFPQSNATLQCNHCTDRLRGSHCSGKCIPAPVQPQLTLVSRNNRS
jgi:hypothetical protein